MHPAAVALNEKAHAPSGYGVSSPLHGMQGLVYSGSALE